MALTTPAIGTNTQRPTFLPNGLNLDVTETDFPLQQGVPLQNIYMFRAVPAPESTTCVAASSAWPGATTTYPLRTSTVTSLGYTLTTPVRVNGVAGVKLDMERGISFTTSGATTSDVTFTFVGYDYRNVAVEFQQEWESGTNGTFNTVAPLSILTSVTSDVNPGVNLSFGNAGNSSTSFGSWIGLPYVLSRNVYVIHASWAGTAFTPQSGQYGAAGGLFLANEWRSNPPTSIPLTSFVTGSSIGVARGVVNLPSPSGSSEALTFTYLVEGSDKELDQQLSIYNQSALNLLQVEQNSDDEFVWPKLTTYDLRGMQYPGDLVAAQEYAALVAA